MASLLGAGSHLLCCLFLCLSLSAVARAATVHHEWEISNQLKSLDCVRKLAVSINGQTPGPTIRATQGDTVAVRVNNSLLTENVAIHWHGIRQIGTPWADGTEGVTQCPILPGDTFIYTFLVDRPDREFLLQEPICGGPAGGHRYYIVKIYIACIYLYTYHTYTCNVYALKHGKVVAERCLQLLGDYTIFLYAGIIWLYFSRF
jgi:hypothetical protein